MLVIRISSRHCSRILSFFKSILTAYLVRWVDSLRYKGADDNRSGAGLWFGRRKMNFSHVYLPSPRSPLLLFGKRLGCPSILEHIL
jgi:hypothetical protein